MKENIRWITYYLNRYRNSFHNEDIVDYYQIFELNKNMDVAQLNREIKDKKLKIFFHTDWKNYLAVPDQEDFLRLSRVVDSMIDEFRDEAAKKDMIKN